MNIELKNVKYFAAMSEETHCFTATVYVDGKRSFTVSNRGHGGCDDYAPLKADGYHAMNEQIAEINAELGKQKVEGYDFNNDLELEVGELMNQWHQDNAIKKTLKKVCFIKEGSVYTTKAKPTTENLAAVKRAAWWKDEFVLLNGLSIEEVRKYF